MLDIEIRAFELSDESAVIALWRRCGLTRPWNDAKKDIARKLSVQPHLFLVGVFGQELVATIMAGYEGHRGWINYLAVAPEYQRQGIGRLMMLKAERLLREAGCPKINLLVRTTNSGVIKFYQHLGYAVDDVVSLGKRLENDE
ncbi:GCN5-related N-acetyltransferase [Scytonema sp. HK-05]|uniref:GNAT family acetyltransferase n=1 Tax=Scytonema sp. HK-05 TaxID=1137095 RepID=UPI0009691BAA|nr:GNAT family acetyltransferase [Scytonema sp. HK-05]OKH59597.1 GNAT family acetyltransferase [Scytonema sp. HK-05]BAY43311.1 GCN5-related N-acetyltransferase [Scytonema sp. HK-05]